MFLLDVEYHFGFREKLVGNLLVPCHLVQLTAVPNVHPHCLVRERHQGVDPCHASSSYDTSTSDESSLESSDEDGDDAQPQRVVVAAAKLTIMSPAAPFVIQRKMATAGPAVKQAPSAVIIYG